MIKFVERNRISNCLDWFCYMNNYVQEKILKSPYQMPDSGILFDYSEISTFCTTGKSHKSPCLVQKENHNVNWRKKVHLGKKKWRMSKIGKKIVDFGFVYCIIIVWLGMCEHYQWEYLKYRVPFKYFITFHSTSLGNSVFYVSRLGKIFSLNVCACVCLWS